jgi:hypothetical protein
VTTALDPKVTGAEAVAEGRVLAWAAAAPRLRRYCSIARTSASLMSAAEKPFIIVPAPARTIRSSSCEPRVNGTRAGARRPCPVSPWQAAHALSYTALQQGRRHQKTGDHDAGNRSIHRGKRVAANHRVARAWECRRIAV